MRLLFDNLLTFLRTPPPKKAGGDFLPAGKIFFCGRTRRIDVDISARTVITVNDIKMSTLTLDIGQCRPHFVSKF